METGSNRGVTIAIVTGVIALLLGLCGGAVLGGIGGYIVGREAAASAVGGPASPFDFGGPQGGPQFPVPQADQGVAVQDVVAGSPAMQGGIQPGDIIVQVDDTRVDATHRLSDIIAGYKPGDTVRIVLQRFGTEHTVNVRLGEQQTSPGKAFLGIRYSQAPDIEGTPTP